MSDNDGNEDAYSGFEVGELPDGWEILTSVSSPSGQAIEQRFTNLGSALSYIMTALMMGGLVSAGIAPAGSNLRTQLVTEDELDHIQGVENQNFGTDDDPDDPDDPLGAL